MIVSGAAATPRLDVETVLLCDVLADGTVAGVALVEPIYDTNTGDRVGTRTVDPVTGAAYTATGTLQPCSTSSDCESPTTPLTSVGLCLADGTPIAVTVIRDCTGAVTSEGWINLSTGAWSAGAPPAGTMACGDARTITVSGTFCDVDDTTGDVLGLVLVEYTYGEDGAISAVRLVDAVTGGTYTPAGTVTVCPAGVEQPERDVVQLCDTSADGTVTPFIRDYARDENGAIVGHSDYILDGAAYTPAGTVGTCQPMSQPDREVVCYRSPTAFGACTNVQITDLPQPKFASASVVANPQNWPVNQANLDSTINGNVAGSGGPTAPEGVINCDASQGDTGVVIDYLLAAPRDNVTAVRMWNSFGSVVTDNDGIGSATVTLYDEAGAVLFTGPLVACQYATSSAYATPCVTPVGNLDGVARMRLENLAKFPPSVGTVAPDIGWREIDLFSTYEATLTVDCGGVPVSALVEGEQPGLTYSEGKLTQVNGPHTLTFTVPGGATGRIITDNPAAFSALDFADGAVITVTGDGAVDFATEIVSGAATKSGYVTWDPVTGEPTVRDANSGETIADAAIVPCGTCGPGGATERCDTTVVAECTYSLPDTITGFSITDPAYPGCWLGTAGGASYAFGDRVTSWAATYQSDTGSASVALFSSPDLGGAISFAAFTPALPLNPANSDPAYVGTAVINGVTVTLTATAGNGLGIWSANDTGLYLGGDDAFRLDFSKPVRLTVGTAGFADPPTLHERFCGVSVQKVPWPAVKLADCQGFITVVDPDTRVPIPADATLECQAPGASDCCEPVQVCVQATVTEKLEFISNEAQVDDDSIDTVWTWTNNGDASGPAAAATWYQMYRARYGFNPAVWSVVDSAPVRKAGWISPHPNGATTSTGAPGEGPTLSGTPATPMRWWAKAAFSLPAAADPDSIRVQITVLNADQIASRFRLNSGAWTALPGSATYNGTPYTFGPGVVAGAQPGTNTLIFEALETVDDNPGNGAGVMAHFIVSYDVPGLGQRSWTRMMCCDGSIYYIDEFGERQDELPLSSAVVPCGSAAEPLTLCDDNGAFLRHVSYVGDQVLTMDTDLNGSAYEATGRVGNCATDGSSARGPVDTGIRSVTGTAVEDLATEFPDLQSVSLAVLAGTVDVTMNDGTSVPIPAGVTLTWSVSKDTDSALVAASFAGADSSASYLLNWTYLS
ncbi:hypothetical protein [Streptomyces sp. NPDC058891]|uniref:hypothetical protein n=1 Tax=Streptomyces sp. NPDC058891 TaxID=3346667 RepID=UPI00367CDC60